MVTMSVYYIAIMRGMAMFGFTANTIETVEVRYDMEDLTKLPVTEMSKPLF